LSLLEFREFYFVGNLCEGHDTTEEPLSQLLKINFG